MNFKFFDTAKLSKLIKSGGSMFAPISLNVIPFNMNTFINIIILIFILSFHSICGIIKGRIISADANEPIPGVNVIIEGTFLGASTNIDGYYEIKNVTFGNHNMAVSYIGYCYETYSISIESTNETLVHNIILKQSPQKIELEYSDEYEEYHENIEEAISNDENTFIIEFKQEISGWAECIFIHPQLQNKYNKSIYVPDRIDYYTFYVNGDEFEKIETIYRFGCPHHHFSYSFDEKEIIEIKPDSTAQMASFYICKQDLDDPDSEEIEIKLRYKFHLPESTFSDNCYEDNVNLLKERYFKILVSEIESKETLIKIK